MREILFRGKSIDTGNWIEGFYNYRDYMYNGEDVRRHYILPPCEQDSIVVDPATVGQYTGLTDKNGKKIFEGDILQLDDGEVGCVVYKYSGFELSSGGCSLCVSSQNERVIIGNFYDNTELWQGR